MLKFDWQGLIPAVIQDDGTGEVLMMAFMNEEALQRTRETGYTHFFSRSRNTIWRKGEQSGNTQEVRDILLNCEENSLLIRVVQHGGAACHTGYRSCYYRRLLPNDSYETIAKRIFDPEAVYGTAAPTPSVGARFIEPTADLSASPNTLALPLEAKMRQLYTIYLYLRDHDLSEQSNTSRLLHEPNVNYLVTRLMDELQELTDVQRGEHIHTGRQPDTILEGSQVAYWLFLLAATKNLQYNEFQPHISLLQGYIEASPNASRNYADVDISSIASNERTSLLEGLASGFALIGWACAQAGISPLAPAKLDLEQMRRKGLIGE